jgi:hypothetical protein
VGIMPPPEKAPKLVPHMPSLREHISLFGERRPVDIPLESRNIYTRMADGALTVCGVVDVLGDLTKATGVHNLNFNKWKATLTEDCQYDEAAYEIYYTPTGMDAVQIRRSRQWYAALREQIFESRHFQFEIRKKKTW